MISDPGFKPLEFFNLIANAYHLEGSSDTKPAFLSRFTEFLRDAQARNQIVLLVIDEAQHASSELLEELRHLLNLEEGNQKLLNLFLVGQNEFDDIL